MNGNIYSGEWRNDKKHGYGEYLYYLKKEQFKGQFLYGVPDGHGQYTFENGDQ